MRVEYSKGQQASSELIQLHRRASSEASSGRKAKVMLVFAPDWYPSEPYLSLPTLTAVLRQAGHTVVQKDVNLEMYDWYFSEDCLKKVLRRVPHRLLDRVSRRPACRHRSSRCRWKMRPRHSSWCAPARRNGTSIPSASA